MSTITIVLRDDQPAVTNTAKHIYTYASGIVPRKGEYIEVNGHPPYEADRVIHKLVNGNDNIIVEVKKIT